MPESRYLYVTVTVPANSEQLEIGISSTPDRHVIVDSLSTKSTAGIYLKAYYQREELMAFPSELFSVNKPEAEMNLDLPVGGILYVGLKNTTAGDVTQDIAIKYHYAR